MLVVKVIKKQFDRKQFFFKPKSSEQSKACSSSSQNNTPIEIEKDKCQSTFYRAYAKRLSKAKSWKSMGVKIGFEWLFQ